MSSVLVSGSEAYKSERCRRDEELSLLVRMSYVSQRNSVLDAIKECQELGRERFLSKYGFRKARSIFLIHEGERYDPRAVLAVAAMRERGNDQAIPPSALSEMEARFPGWVQRSLESLGFTMAHGAVPAHPEKLATSPAEQSESKVIHGVRVPTALLRVCQGRKYEQNGSWVLATRAGAPIARFSTEAELEECWRSFQESEGRPPIALVAGAPALRVV
ncbi:MAG: hypothetical protein GX575_32395 [Candidatus Anammoximicrobium sp.]|nr:hypothetical protein [Candidatus Anammoximicrobium sp.]